MTCFFMLLKEVHLHTLKLKNKDMLIQKDSFTLVFTLSIKVELCIQIR